MLSPALTRAVSVSVGFPAALPETSWALACALTEMQKGAPPSLPARLPLDPAPGPCPGSTEALCLESPARLVHLPCPLPSQTHAQPLPMTHLWTRQDGPGPWEEPGLPGRSPFLLGSPGPGFGKPANHRNHAGTLPQQVTLGTQVTPGRGDFGNSDGSGAFTLGSSSRSGPGWWAAAECAGLSRGDSDGRGCTVLPLPSRHLHKSPGGEAAKPTVLAHCPPFSKFQCPRQG